MSDTLQIVGQIARDSTQQEQVDVPNLNTQLSLNELKLS